MLHQLFSMQAGVCRACTSAASRDSTDPGAGFQARVFGQAQVWKPGNWREGTTECRGRRPPGKLLVSRFTLLCQGLGNAGGI